MLIKLFVLISLLLISVDNSYSWDLANPPGDTDKVLHLAWGAGTELLVSTSLTYFDVNLAPEIGLSSAIVTGIAKELADKNFDPLDALATAGGGLIMYAIDKKIRVYIFNNKHITKLNVSFLF